MALKLSAINSNKDENSDSPSPEKVSPLSNEIVVGLVGYAGAGCSLVADKISDFFHTSGYIVAPIKMSSLIIEREGRDNFPDVADGPEKGKRKLIRARSLQDFGDQLRNLHGPHAIAALAVKKIISKRLEFKSENSKIVYILDSIKHEDEVHLLRRVYDKSFRLVAVHCERDIRESRLIGDHGSGAKYKGANKSDVRSYMDRDEKDIKNKKGQQVRDAFFLADFFIDNNVNTQDGLRLNDGIRRFVNLVIGKDLVRPTSDETGMFHAHAAALQSSCLSRQVGAALLTSQGQVISTGTNDVPRFGGGVYSEGSTPDNRCFKWRWKSTEKGSPKAQGADVDEWFGCHNDRKKESLRKDIASWIAAEFSEKFAELAHPAPKEGSDTAAKARELAAENIKNHIESSPEYFSNLPGIKDLIEYSRAIHAEMSSILSAARNGISTVGTTLYCTTFPCHNCARHLVASGVRHVYYIEPYVKSLASELHGDAISTVLPQNNLSRSVASEPDKMLILPFTGVGPRMYEDFFQKRIELKTKPTGKFEEPIGGSPLLAVRLNDLAAVETKAASLVPDTKI